MWTRISSVRARQARRLFRRHMTNPMDAPTTRATSTDIPGSSPRPQASRCLRVAVFAFPELMTKVLEHVTPIAGATAPHAGPCFGGVRDIDRSRNFYDAALRPLGLVRIVDFGNSVCPDSIVAERGACRPRHTGGNLAGNFPELYGFVKFRFHLSPVTANGRGRSPGVNVAGYIGMPTAI
jgi:hypothetical protein